MSKFQGKKVHGLFMDGAKFAGFKHKDCLRRCYKLNCISPKSPSPQYLRMPPYHYRCN